MAGRIDLHIHTQASADGVYSPREIFDMARRAGLRAIAFADHNSTESCDEGAKLADEFGIEFVPAVEFNTDYAGKDLHLLVYYPDYTSEVFAWITDRIIESKWERARQRIRGLQKAGIAITEDGVREACRNKPPAGVEFWDAIVKYPENMAHPLVKEALESRGEPPNVAFYLMTMKREGQIAYAPMSGPSTYEVIDRGWEAGGIPILAHPKDLSERTLEDLVANGVAGLEVYSSYHDKTSTQRLYEFCRERDLLMTVGSDFHGPDVKPGLKLGDVAGPYELLERLKARLTVG